MQSLFNEKLLAMTSVIGLVILVGVLTLTVHQVNQPESINQTSQAEERCDACGNLNQPCCDKAGGCAVYDETGESVGTVCDDASTLMCERRSGLGNYCIRRSSGGDTRTYIFRCESSGTCTQVSSASECEGQQCYTGSNYEAVQVQCQNNCLAVTATPAATPTPATNPAPLQCNSICALNGDAGDFDCPSGTFCYDPAQPDDQSCNAYGLCRAPGCLNDTTCGCSGNTPSPTQPQSSPSPTSTPTISVSPSAQPTLPASPTPGGGTSDIDADGVVGPSDAAAVMQAYGTSCGDTVYQRRIDICGPTGNGPDCVINAFEVSCLIRDWSTTFRPSNE